MKQTLLAGILFCLGFLPASGVVLWQLGTTDGTAAEFTQEIGGTQPAPGSASVRDDDYYFAGTYGIGTVSSDEPITDPIDTSNNSANPIGLERAVTHTSPENRIHFNLLGTYTTGTDFTFTLPLVQGGYWDGQGNGGFGTHDVEVTFNGVSILSETGITGGTVATATFSAESVNATTGENIINIVRTGGLNNGGNVGWIQMDSVTLEASAAIPEPSSHLTLLLGVCGLLARRRR